MLERVVEDRPSNPNYSSAEGNSLAPILAHSHRKLIELAIWEL